MKGLSSLFLLMLLSCAFGGEAAPRYFTIFKSFGNPARSVAAPAGELCLGSDGRFYGVGTRGIDPSEVSATIFSISKDGTDLRILFRGDFTGPAEGLVEASDGRLYWYGEGGLNSLRADGSDLKMYATPGMSDASKLTESSDGFLYGTSQRHVFRVRPNGQDFQVLREFTEGFNEDRRIGNRLMETPEGVLFGTFGIRYNGGGIYRMNRDGTDFLLLHEFFSSTNSSTRIHSPSTGLKMVDGKLFGVALNSTNRRSTIFSMRMDGSELTLLHSLSRAPAGELVVGPGGKIFGALGYEGAVMFEMDTDGSNYKEVALRQDKIDAPIYATGTPLVVGGRMYGLAMTLHSYSNDGFLYEFEREAAKPTRILSRLSYSGGEGWLPNALLHSADGNLYGTTMRGGEFDNGTIWKVSENGANSATLRSMEVTRDGGAAVALVEGQDQRLYGLVQGTPYNIDSRYHAEYTPWNGSVFRVSKSGEEFEILREHTYEWAGALTVGKDGRIYVSVSKQPTATNDSAYIYSMKSDGSDYAELVRFRPTDMVRLGQAMEATDGNFYVTGGHKILRITRHGSVETIYELPEAAPYSLMEGSDGALYGNNPRNGFFRVKKDGGDYSSKRFWSGSDYSGKRMVEEPGGEFLVIDSSNLYRVKGTNEFPEAVRSFAPWQIRWEGEPVYGLVKGGSGEIYGLMQGGGAIGIGAVFRPGEWTEAPHVSVTRTDVPNLGKLRVGVGVTMATKFNVETAPSVNGPWKLQDHGMFEGAGTAVWFTPQTNEFFRARLLEY